jgi:hypothetical protein
MSQATAALVSLTLAIGLALITSAGPRLRRPSLLARLDPYLRGLEPQRTSLLHEEQPPLTPFPALERLLRPVFDEGARIAERLLGGSAGVARRLRHAGLHDSLPRFRAEQVLWGLGGFGAATLGAVLLPLLAGRRPPAIAVLGGAAFGLLAGVLGRDWWLTEQVDRRQGRMPGEFVGLPSCKYRACPVRSASIAACARRQREDRSSRGTCSSAQNRNRASSPSRSWMLAICSGVRMPPSKTNISESSHGPCGETQSTHSRSPTCRSSPSSSLSSRCTASCGGSLASAMPPGRSQSGLYLGSTKRILP